MPSTPTLWLIAGPNGVGKTTYALRHIRTVSGSVHFVNLDEIARGLSPISPDVQRRRAARVALEMTREFIASHESFSMETTLAGRTHLRTIAAAHGAGFAINLLFFSVATPEICFARIARRVSEGGHDVPAADVRRRFSRAISNFPDYAAVLDLWRVFDNTGAKPIVVAEGKHACISMLGDTTSIASDLADRLRAMPPCPE